MNQMARLLSAGIWHDGETRTVVLDKHTHAALGEVHCASTEQVDAAISNVAEYQRRAPLSPHDRHVVLNEASRLVRDRGAALTALLIAEAGFTLGDATSEVARTADTLQLSANAAIQLRGQVVPLDGIASVSKRMALTIHDPIGVVAAICPFNSPLNTVAHKVGPALAAGNGVVIKPASNTPFSACALAEILLDAGLPPGLLAVLHGSGATVGAAVAAHPEVGFIAFTGSTEVGREIARLAGIRRTQLELGSVAATIVCEDAPVERTVDKIMTSAFRKSGQVCTSTQRLYVHRSLLPELSDALAEQIERRDWLGDPYRPETFTGSLISVAAADRVEAWVAEAESNGARVVCGGGRKGARVQPTLLAGAPPESKVMCQEIFGPVAALLPYDTLDEAVEQANSTPYGLAVGVFTADLRAAMHAATQLRFGVVHINEGSSARVDTMPFGGVKDSGHGKEGPLYAAAEMSNERLITVNYE